MSGRPPALKFIFNHISRIPQRGPTGNPPYLPILDEDWIWYKEAGAEIAEAKKQSLAIAKVQLLIVKKKR